MIHIQHQVSIARPAHDVFAYLADVERMPEWQSGVVRSKRLSEGPPRAGFQFEETVKVFLWTITVVCTVTEYKADEAMAFEARSTGPVDYEGRFELREAAEGTSLTLRGKAQLKGVWRLLGPLFAGDLRKESRAELEALKRNLEARPAARLDASPSRDSRR